MSGNQRIVIFSNDTDVAVYLLHYMNQFKELNVLEIWLRFGSSNKSRFIPIHSLFSALGVNTCNILLKCHVVSGCDVTSKVATKSAVLKNEPEAFLTHLGEFEYVSEDVSALVEKFLLRVIQKNSNCSTFDELR